MKTTKLALILCMLVSSYAVAQNVEHALVEQTISYYLDGGTNNDFELLKKAFHETATMKFVRKGEYKEVNALEFFEKAITPGPKQNRTAKIITIDISGNAAQAKLTIEYPTFYFMDYMNLLKIDGEWKVVSKIFNRQNKN
ncbi:nuclear transport factor 2 family protein [Aquimarina sp. 2-A2]|uniref:nuclear transport factor 2 family protein n=1 Tax=Aquimarina sp. 2-A2 TaxID=3382644 RepID=UPI00387F3419